MIRIDEDALICDLAETYQIYDYRQLPPSKVAVFARGLRDDSRIKMKLNNQLVPLEILLLAGMLDKLSTLVWRETTDGQKGINRPQSIVSVLTETNKKKDSDMIVFQSGEDFEEQRKQIMKGGE